MSHANYVEANPPRCLGPFRPAPANMPNAQWDGHGEELNPVFLVSCGCGSIAHRIHGYLWEDPEATGDSAFLSPIELQCIACAQRHVLLDTDIHGYNAELGHGSGTIRGEGTPGEFRCKSCDGDSMQTLVRFEYPEDVFGDDFRDFGGVRSDLFTWVTVVGSCEGCGGLWNVADFECA